MTGFRIGYLAAPVKFIRAATTLQGQITSCASSIAQKAAGRALAMSHDEQRAYRDEILGVMRTKRDFLFEQLQAIPLVKTVLTEGAFYLFPDVSAYFGKRTPAGRPILNSEDLCLYLLSDFHTALVPGSAFGDEKCIRFAYATSMDLLETGALNFKRCLATLE